MNGNAPGCKVSAAGDPIRLGDTLGHGMEPNLITGRVIAIEKGEHPRVFFRTYANQTEPWPTGPIRYGRMVYPHRHFSDGHCERFINDWSQS